MNERERELMLAMVRRLEKLETSFKAILLARRKALIEEVGSLEEYLELKRSLVPKRKQETS